MTLVIQRMRLSLMLTWRVSKPKVKLVIQMMMTTVATPTNQLMMTLIPMQVIQFFQVFHSFLFQFATTVVSYPFIFRNRKSRRCRRRVRFECVDHI